MRKVDKMRLDEFLSAEREQLLALCAAKLQERSPDHSSSELLGELPAFVDEITAAIRQRNSRSPENGVLAMGAGPAAELGRQRQAMGFDVALTVLSIGVVSDSIGALGAKAGLSFEASDYQIFNQCLDDAMATALTEYWKLDRAPTGQDSVQLAFLAHELRNSLSSVQMAWRFLVQGHAGLHSRTAQVLERNLQRSIDMIAEALSGAQPSSRPPLSLAPVNLAQMLLNIRAGAVPERNISISVSADPALKIEADETLLASAVNNLLQNALKFTHDSGQVQVRATRADDSVVIEVEDECGGLPAGDPEKLFEIFVRGSDPRSTGLGLPIARKAVRAHKGEITVQDLPGKGCVFSIRLPA
ncbi:MAG TPA: HAMP domain-containing sensor histidine kinase [Polyangiaceae bacterium]|nr:HAMP domain-containing sensor histidine kinase [Polyangiaceae bacterium]